MLLLFAIIVSPFLHCLNNSMMQSPPWESNSHSASKEIPGPLWNPKIQYCVYNSPPLDPILSQMNPVHILTSYFFNMHFHITILGLPPLAQCPYQISSKPVQHETCKETDIIIPICIHLMNIMQRMCNNTHTLLRHLSSKVLQITEL
jgi:hypothetical protein